MLAVGKIQLGQLDAEGRLAFDVTGFLDFHDFAFDMRAALGDDESISGQRGIEGGGERVAGLVMLARQTLADTYR